MGLAGKKDQRQEMLTASKSEVICLTTADAQENKGVMQNQGVQKCK